jgi:hypothetical protein
VTEALPAKRREWRTAGAHGVVFAADPVTNNERCTHLDTIEVTELPEAPLECEACVKTGGRWIVLS